MKALVLGCGSIGMRHIGHLRQVGLTDIEAADPDPIASQKAGQLYGIPVSQEPLEALQRKPDIVLVCTQAHLHLSVASQALDAGAHVFIEKPLSTSLKGVDALAQQARTAGRIVQVGYNLRYHPAMKAIKRMTESGRLGKVLTAHAEFGLYLGKWWVNRDYRQSYMAHAELGEGLLLDASHEVDSLLWFLGRVCQVAAFGGKLSNLAIESPDAIKIIMQMESGCIASVHLDCLQPTYTRSYSLTGEDSGLRWDCPDGRSDTSLGRLLWFNSNIQKYQRVQLRGRPEDTYVEELRDFVRCVETGQPPLVGLPEAIQVLQVLQCVQKAIQTGQPVPV